MNKSITWMHIRAISQLLTPTEYKCLGYVLIGDDIVKNKNFKITDIELFCEIANTDIIKPYVQIALFKNFDPNAMAQNLFSNSATNPQDVFNCLAYTQNDVNLPDVYDRLRTMHTRVGFNTQIESLVLGDFLALGLFVQNMDTASQTINLNTKTIIRLIEV